MTPEQLAADVQSLDASTPLFGLGWHRHGRRWVQGAIYGDGCLVCDAAWRAAVPGPTPERAGRPVWRSPAWKR